MLICSSKNVVVCKAGLKIVAICFQQQKLWGCLDLASCSTRWVILLQNLSGLQLLPLLLQCLAQGGQFLKRIDWEKFPGLLDLSNCSHLCCVSLLRAQRLPVFLSWHSPLRGVRGALQMSLQGCIVKAVIKTKKPAPVAVASQILWEPWAVRLFHIPALKCLAFKPSDKLCSCRLFMGKILWSDCHG